MKTIIKSIKKLILLALIVGQTAILAHNQPTDKKLTNISENLCSVITEHKKTTGVLVTLFSAYVLYKAAPWALRKGCHAIARNICEGIVKSLDKKK